MKSLTFYSLLLLFSLLGNAQAATIYDIKNGVTVFASSVTGSAGDFYDDSFVNFSTTSPTNASALEATVTGSDLSTYAWTPNAHMPSNPVVSSAYIDLSFSQNIYNGNGADLVLFFAGTGTTFINSPPETYKFSIDVGANGSQEGGLFDVIPTTTSDVYGGDFFASYAKINLDQFGFDRSTALGDIRIILSDSSMPALAALGAYHVSPMAVPLPLSSVLFASGLALLSLFRKKIKA